MNGRGFAWLVLLGFKVSEISDDQLCVQSSLLNGHCFLLQNHSPLIPGMNERCPLHETFRSLCYNSRQAGPTVLQVHSPTSPPSEGYLQWADLLDSTWPCHSGHSRLGQQRQPIPRQSRKPEKSLVCKLCLPGLPILHGNWLDLSYPPFWGLGTWL